MSARQPVYVLVDTSGSTTRGFAASCAQLLPMLVDEAARRPGLLISVLAYSTQARVLVGLNDPADVSVIPVLEPRGLSSLAAGLRLLAGSAREDARQLEADGVPGRPAAVLVLADGLPTDDDASLLAAVAELADAVPGMTTPVCAMPAAAAPGDGAIVGAAPPAGAPLLAIRGLAMEYRALTGAAPDAVAACALGVFQRLLEDAGAAAAQLAFTAQAPPPGTVLAYGDRGV